MANIELDTYQSLFSLTEKMLELADSEDWDSFVELEAEFDTLSSQLPNLIDIDGENNLSTELVDILTKTVENISRLNVLSQLKHGNLNEGLLNLGQQKKIHLAYSEFSNQAIENRILKDIFKD